MNNNFPLRCVMLIDDNKIDNFFHERVIRKSGIAEQIVSLESGIEALDYLQDEYKIQPDVIFLDINMPEMTGWEFIEHYMLLADRIKGCMIVVMLTTSENPDDVTRAKSYHLLSGFKSKPLTKEMLEEVLSSFNEQNRE